MENELKPCPNCGGQAKLHKRGNKFYVECDGDCWTQTSKYSYQEDAIKEWNGLKRRKAEKELLTCPFCGGNAVFVCTRPSDEVGFYRCENYCVEQCHTLTREEAFDEWNRRCSDGT